MTTQRIITYGPGGYDPQHPDHNIIEVVEVDVPDPPPTTEESVAALSVAARLSVTETVRSGNLPLETLAQLAPIYPPWEPGIAVAVGDVLAWSQTLVECLQSHITQQDWQPGVTPALWRVYRDVANEPETPEWRAGIAVQAGEEMTYQGHVYRVVQAHTTQAGWEPPKVPSLWQLVEYPDRPMVAGRRCH